MKSIRRTVPPGSRGRGNAYSGASTLRQQVHRVGWIVLAVLALCWCGTPRAGELDAAGITAITVEQGCMACAGSQLVLKRDGTAVLVITGNARMGTTDHTSRGSLSTGDFDRLAQLIVTQGFHALKDDYQDPDLQDGAWRTTTVTRGSDEKRVFSRDDAAPPALKRIDDAIDAARGRIRFAP